MPDEEYVYIEQNDAVQADVDLYDQTQAKGGDISGDIVVTGEIEGSIDVSNVHGLAPVATSGDYADLTGAPTEFEGATSSEDGTSGLVPAPEAGDEDKVLRGDGTWGFAGEASAVAWANVTGKPSTFPPSSHAHGNLTDDGKLSTASRAVVTDGDKLIGVSSTTATEIGYLSGLTANAQNQINSRLLASEKITNSEIEAMMES